MEAMILWDRKNVHIFIVIAFYTIYANGVLLSLRHLG